MKKNIKQIIISGSSGFIGGNLIKELCKYNYEIILLVRNKNNTTKIKCRRKILEIKHKLSDKKINFIPKKNSIFVHLAWEDVHNYNSNIHLKKNFPHSLRLIKLMIDKGVKHIFVLGSCFEYGKVEGGVKSSQETKPITKYAKAKDQLRNEIINLKKREKFKFQWGRLFYVYGPMQRHHSLIFQLEQAIKKKLKFFRMSKGDQLRDYLKVKQAVKQIIYIIRNKKNGTFNICSGKPISILNLVKKIIKKNNSKIKINNSFFPYNEYEPKNFWGQR